MTARTQGVSTAWVAVLVVPLLLLGCGGFSVEQDPGGTPAASTTLELPDTPLARLVDFWALRRFAFDNQQPIQNRPWLAPTRIAKTQETECFNGLGASYECQVGSLTKHNQAYVWGLAYAPNGERDSLFFGTAPNVLCLVEGGFLGAGEPQLGYDPSTGTPYWACEFDQAQSGTGDWRPPDLWWLDVGSRSIVSLNPPEDPTPGSPDWLRKHTTGFRSAGTTGRVVFLAGPALGQGLVMFAFDTSTGALLGAKMYTEYTDVRSWVKAGGALYVGVGRRMAGQTDPGGAVLRWRGVASTDPTQLFRFEEVGLLDTEAANLAVHAGRIYVTTWPTAGRPSSLWRSPPIASPGLSGANAIWPPVPSLSTWTRVWSVLNYEPDPLVALTYGGGAIGSYRGRLWWGTMHVPFVAATIAADRLPIAATPEAFAATALGTHRSINVFQAYNLEAAAPAFRLLYGETYLPTYDAGAQTYDIAYDAAHLNRMGQAPAFGASGMGSFFNAYVWSMLPFGKGLFMGTFDWSQVARVGLQGIAPTVSDPALREALDRILAAEQKLEGADLYRFEALNERAWAESVNGLGNNTNYGFRTVAKMDDGKMFVGTANPMNLHPEGGWEVLQLDWLP